MNEAAEKSADFSTMQMTNRASSREVISCSSSASDTEEDSSSKPSDLSRFEITKAIIIYSACSSSLLLVNKLVIAQIPLHSYVSCCQFAFASVAVIAFNETECIDKIEYFDTPKVKAYCIYVLTFILGLYSNFRALEESKIETVIVFRACTPIVVSILDYFFLGRELPSAQSWVSLAVIAFGAYSYVNSDMEFESSGFAAYKWVMVWFCSLCFNMTYGKMILKNVKKSSTWDSVYYTNVLSFLPMFLFGTLVAGEWSKYQHLQLGDEFRKSMVLLFISCVAGLGIGYSGWKCRSLISPTSYTLVGVINKLFTIAMSIFLTGEHATVSATACLVVAISGAAFYRQAPLRIGANEMPPSIEFKSLQTEGSEDSVANSSDSGV